MTDQAQQDHHESWHNLPIEHLVFSTDLFIVFIDHDLDVDWKTSDEYDTLGHADDGKHNAILNRAASLECIPNEHQKKTIRINFKRMVGEAVARSLEHDYQNAEIMLDKAENYITDRNIEIARFWQITTSGIIGLSSAIVLLIAWIEKSALVTIVGNNAFYVFISALFGSIGATLSIIFRIGKTHITSEAEKKLHIAEAVSRNFGGAVSGILISLLVRLGIVVPIFEKSDMTNVAMVAAALIAGGSERWAPSLIEQLEGNKGFNKKDV